MRLVLHVGMNIGDKRYEPGDRVEPGVLSEKQARFLVAEGYADEIEKGQRIPEETKAAIEGGAADPHETVEQLDTKE